MKLVPLVTLTVLALVLTGCPAKTHCQSGPKHGTQCYDHDGGYTTSDSREEEAERADREEPPPATTPRWK